MLPLLWMETVDGALNKKGSRNQGHTEGLNTSRKHYYREFKTKIKYLTLYTFSTENWKRPKQEIKFLFKFIENFLIKENQ